MRSSRFPRLVLDFGAAALALSVAVSAHAAPPSDAERDVRMYRSHVEFLANPFMEGRGPGTRGNELAAEYIEAEFGRLALVKPEFPTPSREGQLVQQPPVNWREMHDEALTYRQPFTAATRAVLKTSILDDSVPSKGGMFPWPHKDSYSVLGFSGNVGDGSSSNTGLKAPMVFVGYSIEKGGPDGAYSSYSDASGDKPLAGKVAVMFRFEPMDDKGESRWKGKQDTLWSPAAALPEKINAAVKRGAVAIILVSPPGCADPRSQKLETTEGSARWTHALDVPAFMMSPEAAERLLKAHDPKKRGIMEWRHLADEKGGVVALDDGEVWMMVQIDRSPRKTWNIAGTLPGRGALKDQYVIIGAHYDHVGYGYTGGSRTDEYGVVHPGADDNASGAAGLMLAAEILKRRYEAMPAGADLRSVMFVAFSAEEMGLIGSREFIKDCPVSASAITVMLNMDMIGRLREGKLEISGTGTAEGFDRMLKPIFGAAGGSGLTIAASPGGRGPSDHATFYGAGVPVLHFFTGIHDQYHTPRDTVDLINFEGGVRVVNLVCDIAEMLAKRPEQLVFKSTDKKKEKPEEAAVADRSLGGVKVRFGIAPGNYADGEAGILVGEVYPGTAAGEAGIQVGDRLIRWNGHELGDVEDWMRYLAQHKPGDVVDVDVKRKTEELRVRVTLKSRDQTPK